MGNAFAPTAGMLTRAPKSPHPQAPKPSSPLRLSRLCKRSQLRSGQAQAPRNIDGFTLLETVIATGILVTALAGIAQLFVLTMRITRESGAHGVALVAAQAKLEALRSLQLAYGIAGERLTDPSLEASPSHSLFEETTDYFDSLDAAGGVVLDEEGAAMFTRRWAITPIDHEEPHAVVIEVCVFRSPADGVSPAAAAACLTTIRSRQP